MPADGDGATATTSSAVTTSSTRTDRVLLGLVYAPVVPLVLGAVAAWAVLASDRPVEDAAAVGVVGLAVGLGVDAAMLPRIVRLGFAAPAGLFVAAYTFHAVVLFVLSMGVPVSQLALGMLAGAVAGRGRLSRMGVRRLTMASLAGLGSLAAALAFARPSTAYDLQRSLDLPFEVTRGLVVAFVLVGGPLLLGAQWVCTTAGLRVAGRRPVPRSAGQRRTRAASSTSSRASSAESSSTVLIAANQASSSSIRPSACSTR